MAEKVKTPVEKLLDDQLQGLILPVDNTLTDSLLWWGIGFILLLGLLLMCRWFKRRNQSRQIALRKLKALSRLASDNSSKKNIAITLSTILRQGLNIPQLGLFNPQSITKWEGFMEKLETASYSTETTTDEELNFLFEQSEYWLNK